MAVRARPMAVREDASAVLPDGRPAQPAVKTTWWAVTGPTNLGGRVTRLWPGAGIAPPCDW
eukprot:9491465-Pyramimonas_sp.AAC.1